MSLSFDAYQKLAHRTAKFPDEIGLIYTALGLNGEAGEVAEIVKKIYRDAGGEISDERREKLKLELGDVLWYISQLARILGLSFDDIAVANVNKLQDRLERGTIHGSGSNR